jgi:hypothetical protein
MPKNKFAAAAIFWKAGSNLGGLLSTFILSFTVIGALLIGVFGAYAAVISILRAFASPSALSTTDRPLLVPKANAAHAGGD